MQAIVLAGGFATRLWPITKDRPKMFLPVGEMSIIDTILEDLEADDRIEDVYVSTNEEFAEDFETYLDESRFEKPVLSIEDTTGEDEKFGVVAALAQLIERESIDDDLLVVAGDNLISFDLADFADFFEEKQTPCLAAYDVGSLERIKSYAAVELSGTEITEFEEKPDEPQTTLASIACYAFPEDTLPDFSAYLSNDNNPDEPGWFMQWLTTRGAVHAFTFDGYWFDIGEADAYLEAVAWALQGEAMIDQRATVENSSIGENVHIMGEATVRNCSIENSVIFPNAEVVDADIETSIIDEAATIHETDLVDSRIGAYSTVKNE